MREELERLRADAAQPGPHLGTEDGKCALPAGIPEVQDGLVESGSMHELVDILVSRTSKRCCGFWGSGGIGKTTTSAWLCRQDPVRRHFSGIVWVALGCTPNICACQQQLYAQLTGDELSVDSSTEEKVQKLRQAFLGRQMLLVLDDIWEAEHISLFAAIDETTKSRVLISSRVRGVLEGCEIVDVGLPTEDDAIQIIMAAAGIPHAAAPPEARQVVRMCNNLPLTLGICGRMVKNLGLQQDWSEVATIMKDELSSEGDARSAEVGIIATSLRAMHGSHAESARALFKAFSLVPEDCRIPLEALQWVCL